MRSVVSEGCNDEGEVGLLILDLLVRELHEVPQRFWFPGSVAE